MNGTPMHIADLTEFYSPQGGVRTYLNRKGRNLRAHGHHHLVVAPAKADARRSLDGLAAGGAGSAQVVELASPTMPYDPNYHFLLRVDRVHAELARSRPDVLSVNSLYMAALASLTVPPAVRAVRVLSWHADFIDTYLRELLPGTWALGMRQRMVEPVWQAVRAVANRFAATFVASRSQADKLRSHGIRNVVEIALGVDRRAFTPDPARASVRAELLENDPDAALVVGVGRLAVEKSWDVVLDAVRRLGTRKKVRLVLFGDGPDAPRLRELADPGCVTFRGFVGSAGEIASAMASADVYVHGGENETYGLSVAEAMAVGAPVVVPAAGATCELVTPGANGELFVPRSSESCAAAIERVLRDVPRYREVALRVADQVPDGEAQVLRTVDAYAELIRARRRERSPSWRSTFRFTT